ncbi:hypothetical protein, partial [Paraburkholderia saeva]|uniref:hypothetical protein n=1 Tax=Paraburkholderia saeva TaxID=2777537 RepID=UPI001E439093
MSTLDQSGDMHAFLAEADLISGLADQMLADRVLIDPKTLAAMTVEELMINGDRIPGETINFLRSLAAQWTCPRMTGHAVTLRLVNLLAGETRVVSSISERCADAT